MVVPTACLMKCLFSSPNLILPMFAPGTLSFLFFLPILS
jgi:hypothetical protein